MNTTEIRIGNTILCNGKPEVVTGVLQYGVYFAFGYCPNVKGLLQPVDITKEMLRNFGFTVEYKRCGYSANKTVNEDIFNLWHGDGWDHWAFMMGGHDSEDNTFWVELRSVHHLQNLFFDLAGFQLVSE